MRLPIQVPAVIREATHRATARLFGGLAPSGFSSAHAESISYSGVLCECAPGPGHPNPVFVECQTNECHWDSSKDMCLCGPG